MPTPNRKSIVVVSLLVVVFLVAIFAWRKLPNANTNNSIVIGAILPMTGDAATFGQNAYRGAMVATNEENLKGGVNGSKIELKVEDSRGAADSAVAAARKLIDIDKASLMMGDVTSAGTHAIIPIATQARIPLVSPAASDPALSNASPFFARVWPSDIYEANVIANYATQKGYRSIACALANTDYGVAMQKQFAQAVTPAHINLRIPLERETLDYRPTIQRIISSGADALFIVLYPEDAKRFLQQASEENLSLPILATATIEDPSVSVAPGADRIVFASPAPPDDNDAARKAFVTAYRKQFNVDPGVVSDTGYDATKLLIEAARKQGTQSGSKELAYIKSLQGYKGASGILTFSDTGDVRKPYRLRTVRGGKFAWLT